eukprot:GHVS01012035.1.p1 GENE.GHVS01012035.1~~GHVS01012035.1.p1  ORF type:complete len:130 (-),score=10.42 GHVS01012035.1:186-575(-)
MPTSAAISSKSAQQEDSTSADANIYSGVSFSQTIAERFRTLRNFKVTVFISSVGSASKLARQKFSIDGNSRFEALIAFLRKALKRNEQPLFVYVNNAFQPQPDDYIADLYSVYNIGGYLKVSYSFHPAF